MTFCGGGTAHKADVPTHQTNWGLYLMTASYVIFLGSVILNAWKMLLGVGQTEKMTKAN
jgi:hypothetical protein